MRLSRYLSQRLLWLVAALVATLLSATSCEDTLSAVGSSTMPESDILSIRTDTFHVAVATGYRDSVYVRTGYPLLGNITDPEYGSIKAGYLAQFYASSKIGLTVSSTDTTTFDILRTSAPRDLGLDPQGVYTSRFDSLVDNCIDSLTMCIYYDTYYGDSLTPMKLSVYALNSDARLEKEPERAFYSNYDFSRYYNTQNILGTKAYTAANRVLSDSLRSLSSYKPYIEIRLDDKWRDTFLNLAVEAAIARDSLGHLRYPAYRDVFTDIDLMRSEFLSGVAVNTTFGDGCIIKVYNTSIWFYYRSFHKYYKDGTLLRNSTDTGDSTYITSHVQYMSVTPDVVQMSNLALTDTKQASRLNDVDNAYITSPQGYYATVDLPVGRLIRRMMDDPLRQDSSYFLNGANFSLLCEKPAGALLSATPPSRVLLVEESKMNKFFEESRVPSSDVATVGTYVADSVSTKQYYFSFGNINTLMMGLAAEESNGGWDKELTTSTYQWAKQIYQVHPEVFKGIDAEIFAAGNATMYDNNTLGIKTAVQQALDAYTIRMAVIPVDVTTSSSSGNILSVSNYILPSAIKVKRDESKQYLQCIYTVGGAL